MDHTLALITKSQQGDKKARDTVFEENTGLIYSVAKRFVGRGVEMEDLIQIGSIGLLKAVDHFNASFEVKFSTYAVPMIVGEIKRFLRDDGMIKVSRSLKELAYRGYLCQEALGKKLGREPCITEVAAEMQVEPEELVQAFEATGELESLHKPIYRKDGQELTLADKLASPAEETEEVLNHMFLKELLASLNKEERRLIYLRYFAERTQSQVGEELGISQVQVSRMEKKILKSMREQI